MDFHKAIVLVLAVVLLICLPLFMFFFGKALYHYCKMIVGIKREVYSRGLFVLGGILLTDKSFFDEVGKRSRMLFFKYLKKSLLLFIIIFMSMSVIKLVHGAST